MKKSFYYLFLSFCSFQAIAQTTVSLSPSQGAAIGFHNGFSTANNNYNNAAQFAAYAIPGTNTGVNVNRALMQFNFASIPAGAIITSAKLNLYKIPVLGVLSAHTIGNNETYLKKISQSWNEATVTWNNAPSTTTDNQVLLAAAVSSNQDYLNIDMTSMVQYFIANPSSNFGFLFGLVNETPTRVLGFCSDSYENPAKRPTLEVTYCVAPSLSISASGNTTFCEGGSVQLNVQANANFEWNDGGIQNPRTISAAGTYFVQTGGACAANSNSIQVNVNDNPEIPVISPAGIVNINQGSSVMLTSSAAASYLWAPYSQSTQSIIVNQSGSYSVRAFNEAGCSTMSSATTVNVIPVIEPPFPSGCSAVEVMDYNPAKRNDGTTLPAARTNSLNVLGAAQNSDATTTEANVNFASLGFGGSLTVRMSGAIANGPGDDITVFETTFGSMSGNCSRYPETVRAFASQDNCNWVYLGEGCQNTSFDLGELDWAEYIRLVDVSPISSPYENQIADGYDVDGIECLNGLRENPVMQDLGGNYAMSVVAESQGLRKNGTPVAASRSNSANVLGAPQNTNTVNFFALGFGGSVTVKLGYVVFNKSGNDIQVVETSFGNPSCAAYAEKALVEVSLDNLNWIELGQLCLDGSVDMEVGGATAIQYVKITDRSAASAFSGAGDGYDVDGIVVLQPGCSASNSSAKIVDDVWTKDELALISLNQSVTRDVISLQIPAEIETQSLTARIFSTTGQQVLTSSFNVINGSNASQLINLQSLSNGIYIVTVQGQNLTETFKVIKQ